MNLGTRVYLGAVAGALAVLLIHPRSRPFLLSRTLWPSTAQALKSSPRLPENLDKLPNPVSMDDASLWLQIGSQQDLEGPKLTEENCLTLAEIARAGAKSEPENAFWPQMESMFVGKALKTIGRGPTGAIDAWMRASRLTYWNDHQNERLTRIAKDLEKETGAPFAWQQAVAYSRRSTAVGQRLLRHSRQLAIEHPGDQDLRVANILNGSLIREGARSVPVGVAGATMVDMAGLQHPETEIGTGSARSTALAQGKLLSELPRTDQNRIRQVLDAVSSNDAWYVLVPVRDYSLRAIDMIRGSILVAVLPTALFVCGLIGVALYLFGAHVAVLKPVRRTLNSSWALWLGLAVGAFVYAVGRFVFPAIWAFLVFASFGIASDRYKSASPTGLGVVFKATLGVLAVLVAIALSVHFLETSASEQLLASAAALPAPDGSTSVVPLQLCFLGLSMVVATAPAWGILYRYEPSVVLPMSLKTIGGYLGAGGLSLAVVATPLCLLSDQRLAKDITEMVLNEPNHYLARSSGP